MLICWVKLLVLNLASTTGVLLQPFFTGDEHPKCAVARELVKRWLGEELRSIAVFEQPQAVTDYLKIDFAGREYESFVVLFLDAHNRLFGT